MDFGGPPRRSVSQVLAMQVQLADLDRFLLQLQKEKQLEDAESREESARLTAETNYDFYERLSRTSRCVALRCAASLRVLLVQCWRVAVLW